MALADKKAAGSKAAANMPSPEKGTDVPVSAQEKTGEPAQAGNGKPRIGVFVCHCGSNIAGFLDVEDVTEYSATLPNVVFATRNLYTCAEDGISAIKQAIKEHDLNRVVVASCTPRTHEPLFRAACEEAGLNKYLFEFANIRDQCSWVHMHEWDAATAKAKDLVRMSVMRASLLEPLQEISIDIFPASCIIGAGIAGMTAALSIAAQGYEVYLVEKEAEVGGMLRGLDSLTPTNADPEQIIASYLKRIKAASNIHLYTGARLKAVNGYFGNFDVTVSLGDRDETFKVGTLVVATGAEEMKPDGLYGYGELSNVVTEGQLELMLKEDRLGEIKDAVIIGCVGSRGERVTYCNRICCMVGIKNAIALKEKFPKANVSVLHNDIQVYGVIQEDVYKKARGMGIRFRKYSPERRPQVSADGDRLKVTTWLELMQREVEIPADLVCSRLRWYRPRTAWTSPRCCVCRSARTSFSSRPTSSCARSTSPPTESMCAGRRRVPRTSRRASPRPTPPRHTRSIPCARRRCRPRPSPPASTPRAVSAAVSAPGSARSGPWR